MCDKQRLSQILVNLLSNAIKFTFEGFIKVSIQRVEDKIEDEEIKQSSKMNSQVNDFQNSKDDQHLPEAEKQEAPPQNQSFTLKFSVQDTGIGMKDEDFSNLFKVLGKHQNQEAWDQTANPQGLGLGLTICNKILNQFPCDSS